jgi:hypothetical protein
LNHFELGTIVSFRILAPWWSCCKSTPASGDEPKTVYEGCYETKDIFIFTWSSVPDIGHYCWLHGLIHQLPPNSKNILLSSHHSSYLKFPVIMNYHYGIAQDLTCTCSSLLSLFII